MVSEAKPIKDEALVPEDFGTFSCSRSYCFFITTDNNICTHRYSNKQIN